MKDFMQRLQHFMAGPWVPQRYGKMPYLWLSSLLYLFVKYYHGFPSPLELACLIATVLLFVPLYLASFQESERRTPWLVGTTVLLGVLWAPSNYGASCFFIFAAGMCGGVQPVRRAYAVLAMVLATVAGTALLLPYPALGFAFPALAIGIPVGMGSIIDGKLRRSNRALLRKQEEVEHMATIAERERISRDLHDLLGHTLSLITLKAELAGKLATRDLAACRAEITDIENSARQALAEVRSAVSGYRQTGFEHEVSTARASLAAAGVTLNSQVQKIVMPAAAENALSLALREAVTNIVRHARASRCELALVQEEGAIVLRIADNGKLLSGSAPSHGNGLSGMQERVGALGGQLALRVEQGLALELRLPLGAGA